MYSKVFLENTNILIVFLLSTCCLAFSFDNQPDLGDHYMWHTNNRISQSPNSDEVYEDYPSIWKRAQSVGFYGVRGKKPSAFFGMRGKKGPTGFYGVRGKKMDPSSGYSIEHGWSLKETHGDERLLNSGEEKGASGSIGSLRGKRSINSYLSTY